MSTAALTPPDPARERLFGDLLHQLTSQVPDIVHALAMSGDGLVLAHTPSMTRDRADQLCAAASGLASIGRSTTGWLEAGQYAYTMQVMDAGVLLIKPTPDGSAFAALARAGADMGQVAYQLGDVANRVGMAISPGLRR